MKRIVVSAALLSAVATGLLAQGMPPTLVETGIVSTREFHDQITLVGRTEALSNSQIVSEVYGRVIRVDASEGNDVRRGGVLVSIDADRIRLTLEAKRAQVEQAEAAATLAEKELARAKDLRGQDLISEGGFDTALAEHTRARGLHKQYVAEMKQLELDVANSAIRAPFNGYTVRKLVDVGEWVSPGTPVYEVVSLETIKVIVELPERYFGTVSRGTTVSIAVSGRDDATLSGVITGIAPSASEVTHTFPVIIEVDNRARKLGAGMLVRSTLSLDRVFSSLAVSKDAIVRQGERTMVYTIADGKAAPIPVRMGSTDGTMVAIEGEGLAEGMTVIVRGNERVFPGSPVRTAEPQGGGESSEDGEATKTSSND